MRPVASHLDHSTAPLLVAPLASNRSVAAAAPARYSRRRKFPRLVFHKIPALAARRRFVQYTGTQRAAGTGHARACLTVSCANAAKDRLLHTGKSNTNLVSCYPLEILEPHKRRILFEIRWMQAIPYMYANCNTPRALLGTQEKSG